MGNMIPQIVGREITEFCMNIGVIEFNFAYSDKTKFKETYWESGDYYEELFKTIKRLLSECEYTPAVLLTSEDYDDDQENEQQFSKITQSILKAK